MLLVEGTLFLLLLERFLPPFNTATPVVDVGIVCAGSAALAVAAGAAVLPNIELAEFFIFDAALLAAPVILLKKLGCAGATGGLAAVAGDDISKDCFEFISAPPFIGVLESFAIICANPFVSFVSNCWIACKTPVSVVPVSTLILSPALCTVVVGNIPTCWRNSTSSLGGCNPPVNACRAAIYFSQ